MLRKILIIFIAVVILSISGYLAFLYYAPYSEGVQSGELIKISNKGMVFKTYEGELSKGIYGSKIFSFSVLDKDVQVIEKLKEYQGQYVKLTYIERYRTFPWWGDTRHFVTSVEKEKSPNYNR